MDTENTKAIILENEAIMHDMEAVKFEWEKRAKSAEKNLLKLVHELDQSATTIKGMKRTIKNKEQQKIEQQNILSGQVQSQKGD